ncbi:MAG: hydrogenase maturation protease [Ginsengibacter sp.]
MDNKKTFRKGFNKKRICIVGIGNTLRADDGVGGYVCQLIEEKNLDEVTIMITQQLDIGMTEDLSKFNTVIFVDASLTVERMSFERLSLENNQPQSFSHHVNAATLVGLATILYATNTQFYICAISGNNFEIGNTLSEKTRNNALQTVSFLTEWIQLNS